MWIFQQILASSWAHADRPNIYSPLFRPPARHSSREREREGERDIERKRESYIFNRLIFSLREGKLNTSTLPPTHTRSFFVSFGKFFYFTLAWSRKEKKWREERRVWKEKEEKRREERTSPQSFSPFLVRAQAPTESLCNFQSLRIQVLIKAPWGTAHNITLHFQALWKDAPRGLWLKFLKCRHCKKGTPGESPRNRNLLNSKHFRSPGGSHYSLWKRFFPFFSLSLSSLFFFFFFTKHVLLTCWQIAQWSV